MGRARPAGRTRLVHHGYSTGNEQVNLSPWGQASLVQNMPGKAAAAQNPFTAMKGSEPNSLFNLLYPHTGQLAGPPAAIATCERPHNGYSTGSEPLRQFTATPQGVSCWDKLLLPHRERALSASTIGHLQMVVHLAAPAARWPPRCQ